MATPQYLELKEGNVINDFKTENKHEDTDKELRLMRDIIPEYLENI